MNNLRQENTHTGRIIFRALLLLAGVFLYTQTGIAQQKGTVSDTGKKMFGASVQSKHLTLGNVFDLENATSPRISPDGKRIVYLRNFMDKMKDRRRSNLWMVDADGSRNRPLTSGNNNYGSPRWSPSGDRLLYTSSKSGSNQLYIRWMDTGQSAKITNLTHSPGGPAWSPDGKRIAFTMFVPKKKAVVTVPLPDKPKGAEWAKRWKVIHKLHYRQNGAGYLKDGYRQIFLLSAEGGTPRQLTSGPYNYSSPQWSPDGKYLFTSANRHKNRIYKPANTEIYRISVNNGTMRALTDRKGPDNNPIVSPDGRKIVYTGHEQNYSGYQPSSIYIMNADGSGKQKINMSLDRNPRNIHWSSDGKGLYMQYVDEGNGKVAFVSLGGDVNVLGKNLGGASLGRPYVGGSYSVARDGTIAYTYSRPSYPADIAVTHQGSEGPAHRLTSVNKDLFGHKQLGQVEEIRYKSSYDGKEIQGWIVTPPDFDPGKKYPLLLEIHGGPRGAYGDVFSMEEQLYAAAGYVVLYTNPRGSTSYGKAFSNEITNDYPGHDYDDLMSGVDAVIKRGYIDEDRLYVEGGSGGGILTAWIVGHTDRFRAAVSAKPLINWYSSLLTTDLSTTGYKRWFPGLPWNHLKTYMAHSPISYAGNVTTPTMMMTGEEDYRTPSSEAEQFYTALKLEKVETVMVRIPGANHHITARPSNLMRKVAYIRTWFEMHK